MSISVVIPLYNKEKTISRAIDSVLAQELTDFEIIVVDDGSMDASRKIAESYGDKVTYIRQENAGPSAARNRGVRASRHPVIAFLDADDEYLPGCLKAHIESRIVYQQAKLSLASFHVMRNGELVGRSNFLERVPEYISGTDHAYIPQMLADLVINVPSGSICINKELFDEIGGFDEMLRCWEITDFLFRATLQAGSTTLLNQILVQVHQDEDNSQFARTKRNAAYIKRFAEKILDRLQEVPEIERPAFVSQLNNFLYNLWDAGALSEFKEISCKMKRHDIRGRLASYALLPRPLLKILYSLHLLATKIGN